MTLDEAIQYCEEVAEVNQSIADNTEEDNWMDIAQCTKCAEEHYQLSEWLRELKQLREQPEIIRCKDCKHRILNDHYGEKGYMKLKAMCNLDTGDLFGLGREAEEDEWYCADAERRTDGTD